MWFLFMSLWGRTINQSSRPLPICLYLKDITQFNLVELWQLDILRTQIHTGRPHITRLKEKMYSEALKHNETHRKQEAENKPVFLTALKYSFDLIYLFHFTHSNRSRQMATSVQSSSWLRGLQHVLMDDPYIQQTWISIFKLVRMSNVQNEGIE